MSSVRSPSSPPPSLLHSHLVGLPQSVALSLAERCASMEAAGRPVYKLGMGISPFPVPKVLAVALREHAEEKDYLPAEGLPALREAIAAYLERKEGLDRSPDSVLVGPGIKPLLFLMGLAFRGELLLPGPSWAPHSAQARILARPFRRISCRREAGWMLTPEDLVAAFPEGTHGHPRILILSYPSNPTGSTFRADQLAALAETARELGLFVLSDEVYGELHHKGHHQSIARYYPEGTIVATGLSSWCGAGGWRLGAFSFPVALAELASGMAAAASEIWTSASTPVQHAAIAAFEGDPSLERYLRNTRRVLSTLARWCARRLRTVGVECPQPMGGFYLMIDLDALREPLKRRGIHGAESLCLSLLEETGIASVPGTELGLSTQELILRLAYVDFDGSHALNAVDVIPREQPLDEIFLKRHCRPVVEATERLCAWIEGLGEA